jgi:hypothetical protein
MAVRRAERAVERRRVYRTLSIACAAASIASCRGCEGTRDNHLGLVAQDEDRDSDESEDREDARDNFWRVHVVIVGRGRVTTAISAFDCRSDGLVQSGECGPKLVRFHELRPPLLVAAGSDGWVFDHWESVVRRPDGTTRPRILPLPDGPRYLNGFGYEDTGELETVTAVFVTGKR